MSNFRQYHGKPDFLFDVTTGALGYKNRVTGLDVSIDPMVTPDGFIAPPSTGNPQTDYTNLNNIIQLAGPNGTIKLPYANFYVLSQPLILLNGQKLLGNSSTFQLANQVSSALTASAVLSSASAGVQQITVQVASSAGFFPGQYIALDDRTTAGSKTFTKASGNVASVPDSTHVVLNFSFNQNTNVYVTSDNTTFLETGGNSYTWPVGATLCSISPLIVTLPGNVRNVIDNISLDGNSLNNPLANRWELSPVIQFNASDSILNNIYITYSTSDSIYVGGKRLSIQKIWIDRANSLGFHFGASQGAGNGAQKTMVSHVFIDSPGMGNAQIGHYGGLSAVSAAYAAFGFSTNTDHIVITHFDIKNTYNGPLSQGIGCITNNTNLKLEFGNGYIDGMAMGAFQITGGTGSQPQDIDLHDIHVSNCAPTVLNQSYDTGSGSDAKYCSFIGSDGVQGGSPLIGRVRIRDSDFLDSPLGIAGVTDCKLANVTFTASAIAKSCTLFFPGPGNVGDTVVQLNNVTSTRPKGNPTGAPLANQFNCCIYSEFATMRGEAVRVVGGGQGFSANGGGNDIWITGFAGEDNYSYGIRSRGSAILHLQSPTIRLNSGFTADTAWAGIENNSGGGTGGRTTVVGADIDAVTTNAGQHGINLSPNTTINQATDVIGGRVWISGTSTTPIASGGATGVSTVSGVTLSHSFTPGAAEVLVGGRKTATLASGSAVSLTSGAAANVCSITNLPAGVWDITGVIDFHAAGSTVVTSLSCGSNTTSATLGAVDTYAVADLGLTGPATDPAIVIPTNRIVLTTPTTVYLVASAVFSVSTMTAYGTINATAVAIR